MARATYIFVGKGVTIYALSSLDLKLKTNVEWYNRQHECSIGLVSLGKGESEGDQATARWIIKAPEKL